MIQRARPAACFAGIRIEALEALRRHTQVSAVVTLERSRVYDSEVRAGRPPHVLRKGASSATFDFMARLQVDLVLSAGFPLRLPRHVLQSGPLFVNSHPALLPAYRGYSVIREAYANGEAHMGVTVHHMVEELDAGPIVAQERVRVGGMELQEVFDLLFGVVEPMTVTRALETLLPNA